jgi:hypothetical protein
LASGERVLAHHENFQPVEGGKNRHPVAHATDKESCRTICLRFYG